jgi:hypothetical protein
MENYYFTFGQTHFTQDGTPMKDYYVKVTASDYGEARDHFCNRFAAPVMGSHTKWAFQYKEADFSPEMFPNGEYEHLWSTSVTAQKALENGDL